jgi:phosphate transport system substrate-binding protein
MSRSKLIVIGAILTLLLAACGSGGTTTTAGQQTTTTGGQQTTTTTAAQLSGTVRIDGSSTVAPLSEAAAELYMATQPGVRVTVATSGTSGGFQKFCIGETDMNDASRPIKQSEIDLCTENNIAYEGIQVANDALSVLVNPNNPLTCMTVDQVSQIWDADSPVKKWGDIDGLDLPAEFTGQALTPVGPGSDSGTFDFFTEVINGEAGRIRIDYTNIGEDDTAAVRTVEGDVGAIGYVPYSYYQSAGDRVKALAIDAGGGCVDATLENVQNGTYVPLGRPLFVYASDTALERPEVLDFMVFYVENAEPIAEAATFVPMTLAQAEEQLAKVHALAGTAG